MWFYIKNRRAYTLTEILIAFSIVGLMAAFAMPDFDKGNEMSMEKSMAVNLAMIREGMNIYKARNGKLPLETDLNNINEINDTLGLGIIPEEGVVYRVEAGYTLVRYEIEAYTSKYDWSIQISSWPNIVESLRIPHKGSTGANDPPRCNPNCPFQY